MSLYLQRTPVGIALDTVNECINPSFEVDTSNWTANFFGTGGAGTDDRSSTAASGSWSIRKTWTTACTASSGIGWRYQHNSWIAGMARRVIGQMRSSVAQTARISVKFFDYTGTQLTSIDSTVVNLPANTWVTLSGNFTAPEFTASAQVWFILDGSVPVMPVNSTLLLDTVQIRPDLAGNAFFTGSSGASSPYSYTWAGAANASASYRWIADPSSYLEPVQVNGYDDSDAAPATAHQLLSGATVATFTASQAAERVGTLHLLFADRPTATVARRGLATPGTWHYVDTDNAPEAELVFVVTGPVRLWQSDSRSTWLVDVPFSELT